jgi:yecA family protein
MTQQSLFSYEEVDLILRGEGDNDFVGMSAIDGLIAAVVAGPAFIERDEWLRQIIGDRAIAAAPGSQTHLLTQSIMRRHDEVAEILAHRPEAYLPMFMQDEGAIVAEEWTIGFMLGVGMRAKAWGKIMLSSFRQTLAPILSVHLVGRRMMPDVPESELDQIAATAPGAIAKVVPALYRHCADQHTSSRRLAKSRSTHRR